jgi:transcriptional regulator with XRE-family HTH domain
VKKKRFNVEQIVAVLKQAESGVPHIELTRRVGISQGYLSEMERGKKEIGAEALLWVSRDSGKSIECFLTGK